MKHLFSFVLVLLAFFVTLQVEAKAKPRNPAPHLEREMQIRNNSVSNSQDSDLVDAVNSRRPVNFVAANGLLVVKVLPDDTNGREHQKWIVQLSNGDQVEAVYNSDMCPRVPVQVGDVVDMAGQFIWTQQGGLLHWLHRDPHGRRPDGYVKLDGTVYCGN